MLSTSAKQKLREKMTSETSYVQGVYSVLFLACWWAVGSFSLSQQELFRTVGIAFWSWLITLLLTLTLTELIYPKMSSRTLRTCWEWSHVGQSEVRIAAVVAIAVISLWVVTTLNYAGIIHLLVGAYIFIDSIFVIICHIDFFKKEDKENLEAFGRMVLLVAGSETICAIALWCSIFSVIHLIG